MDKLWCACEMKLFPQQLKWMNKAFHQHHGEWEKKITKRAMYKPLQTYGSALLYTKQIYVLFMELYMYSQNLKNKVW